MSVFGGHSVLKCVLKVYFVCDTLLPTFHLVSPPIVKSLTTPSTSDSSSVMTVSYIVSQCDAHSYQIGFEIQYMHMHHWLYARL